MMPAAAALTVLAVPIIDVLFRRGAFGAPEVEQTAMALAAFAVGLPALMLVKSLTPGFYAREDTRTPVKIAVASAILNVGLAALLMLSLRHVGIALAASAANWLNALLLAVVTPPTNVRMLIEKPSDVHDEERRHDADRDGQHRDDVARQSRKNAKMMNATSTKAMSSVSSTSATDCAHVGREVVADLGGVLGRQHALDLLEALVELVGDGDGVGVGLRDERHADHRHAQVA